ncbi:MAG: hypothetical protein ABIK07_09630 [Planctomycetota bacterium]
MSLSKKQLNTLKNIRTFEEKPPDFIFVLKKHLAYGLKVSVPLGLVAYLMYIQTWLMPAAFVSGIICGTWYIIFINIMIAKRVRFWAFLTRVISWQKCDELMGRESVRGGE